MQARNTLNSKSRGQQQQHQHSDHRQAWLHHQALSFQALALARRDIAAVADQGPTLATSKCK